MIEIGFAPTEAITLNTAGREGFRLLLVDGDSITCSVAESMFRCLGEAKVVVANALVSRESVNGLLAQKGFVGEVDVLAIDIDGNDYWVWDAVKVVSPRIAVIEYNDLFGPEEAVVIPYNARFIRDPGEASGFYFGASLAALVRLGKGKGYRLVAVDSSGVNAFFLRNDISASSIPTLHPREAFRYQRRRNIDELERNRISNALRNLPLVWVQ